MLLGNVVVYFGGLEFGMDKKKDSSDYSPTKNSKRCYLPPQICPKQGSILSGFWSSRLSKRCYLPPQKQGSILSGFWSSRLSCVIRKRLLYFLPWWACTLLLFSEESSDTHYILYMEFQVCEQGPAENSARVHKYLVTTWSKCTLLKGQILFEIGDIVQAVITNQEACHNLLYQFFSRYLSCLC